MKKGIMLLLVFLVLASPVISPVFALGVVPSRKSITFEPNLEKTVDLKISGVDGKVLMYTEGELAPYISIPSGYVDVKGSKVVSYTLNLPGEFEEPGNHLGKVIIRQIKEGVSGKTAVGATVEVASELNVFVPYTGQYAEAKLHMPTFERGKRSSFAVEVINKGNEDITDAKVIIDILGPFGEKIDMLESSEKRIPKKETKQFILEWTPRIKSGQYKAKVTLIYGDKNAFDEEQFKIGSPDVEIVSLSAGDYKLGGVAKFDILVESEWNLPMENIYGEVSITQDGNVFTRTETPEKELPAYGKQKLSAFWETQKAGVGDYKLEALVHFLKNQKSKEFDIQVKPNEIVVQSPTGQVTERPSKGFIENYQIIIIVILLVIVGINVYMFRKLKKRGS